MKGILVSLYDSKADSYTQPTVSASNADAIRQLSILVNDSSKPSMLAQHPEDFTLFRLAAFDDDKIVPEASKVALANGIDVVIPNGGENT